jgi:glutamine synthetase
MAVATKSGSKTSPRQVIERAKAEGVEVVDVRFIDLPGTWQHFSLPLGELEVDSFSEGLGFDGSSIRGFQAIDESDMLLIPDPDSATIDPCLSHKTLFLICDVVDPITREPYSRDGRFIAKKAEEHLRRSGIADVSYWGPEAEFYLFNSMRFDQNAHSGYYYIDSEEGIWNSGRNSEPNLAFRPRHKEGYFPVPPTDKLQDLRSEIMLKLIEAGIQVEVQHHEVGTAGQAEIDMRYDTLTKMGDKMMVFKYVIKNIAAQHGYVATFMPKPLFQDNGSGMHVHQSLWKDGENLFADSKGYAGLSEMAVHYIGGLLKHAPALLALCAPTTNSSTPSATARLACASRCTRPTPRPSAWSSARRTPPPTPTWRSRPASWPALTASSGRSRRRSRWTRTSTSSRVKRRPASSPCPARSANRSTRSRRTTRSCSRATCSPRTS